MNVAAITEQEEEEAKVKKIRGLCVRVDDECVRV